MLSVMPSRTYICVIMHGCVSVVLVPVEEILAII